jgi:hypothetical protein
MKNLAGNFGVAVCGLITSIMVAVANVAIARKTSFDLFTLSIWVIVPVGALLVGMVSASGYYVGALWLHRRATRPLLAQMVFIAAFTQALIYWLGYTTTVLDNGSKLSDLIPFTRYVDIMLTSAHYRIGRMQADVGSVGAFGYVLAAIQFLGFLFGGLVVYAMLHAKPVCEPCNLYLRSLATKRKGYRSGEEASVYYDKLFSHPVDSEEFAALIQSEAKSGSHHGAFQISTALLGCPQCKTQLITESVQVHNGREWKAMDELGRRVRLPEGTDLRPVFRAKAST